MRPLKRFGGLLGRVMVVVIAPSWKEAAAYARALPSPLNMSGLAHGFLSKSSSSR
jgi:hypothetical protein